MLFMSLLLHVGIEHTNPVYLRITPQKDSATSSTKHRATHTILSCLFFVSRRIPSPVYIPHQKHRNYAGKYLICTLDINVFLKIKVFKSQMHRQHVYQKSMGLFFRKP